MVVWTGLLFLDHTAETQTHSHLDGQVGQQTRCPNLTLNTFSHAGSFVELTVLKVKAVEVQAFDQIPQSLGLERCHCRVAHFTERRGKI